MINFFLNNKYFELGSRWVLGLIFLYASFHKITDPAAFAKIIYGYGLFPNLSINIFAIALPYIELFAGVFLIIGILPRTSAVIINSMLLSFIIAISINLARGWEFNCGCFSSGNPEHHSSAQFLLLRDILYFSLGILVIFFKEKRLLIIKEAI